jgi:hypothetical protein
MPKPTSLPAAEQAADHISTALEHTADVFSFAATTAVAAVEPDVNDPPGSVLTSVLSEVDPHGPADFPDGGEAAIIAHAPPHVQDWIVG